MLFPVVPVPLGYLLPVHADLVTHLDALFDVPLVRVRFELVHKQLHLAIVLPLTPTIKRKLQPLRGYFHVGAFLFNVVIVHLRHISGDQFRCLLLRVERNIPGHRGVAGRMLISHQ